MKNTLSRIACYNSALPTYYAANAEHYKKGEKQPNHDILVQ